MRKRRVAIVYTHALFARGIACLLEAEPRLEVACVDATQPGIDDELRRLQPHAVVVEQNGGSTGLNAVPMDLIAGEQWALLIVVDMKDPGMELFYNRRFKTATPDTLLEALLGNPSGLRRWSLPKPAASTL